MLDEHICFLLLVLLGVRVLWIRLLLRLGSWEVFTILR